MAFARGRTRDLLWILGASALIAVFFVTVYLRSRPGLAEQIAGKTQRLERVHAVRIALAAVSEAQNSAVMSTADQDTQYFVAQARAASIDLDRHLKELDDALATHHSQEELQSMSLVKQALAEFERLDKQLLDLATQSSNRKAYALAFGPVAKHLQEMDEALARVASKNQEAHLEGEQQIASLVSETRIAALRIQTLLLPHIAEEHENEMEELEAQIAQEDQTIVHHLESLTSLLKPGDQADLARARALYAEFSKLREQIIKLSRENTNVRSLSLAVNEKRKAMLAVEDALARLEQAIDAEEIVTTIPLRR